MADQGADRDPLRSAIERFGFDHAPEVVAQAREEAIERATELLADSLTRSLLDAARAELGEIRPSASQASPARAGDRPAAPTSPPTPAVEGTDGIEPAEPAEPDLTAGYAEYVYGVMWADAAPPPAGLEGVYAGEPVLALEHQGLSAIVSRVPLAEFDERHLETNLNDVAWLERTARAHEAVLEAVLASTTVVPLRLCTIYRGETQVRETLDREREVFEDALRRLDGKAEWGVKLIADPGALDRALSAADDPDDGEVSAGVAYMRERSREAHARDEVDRIAEEWADRVHARVSGRAAEALLNPLQNPEVSGHRGEMLLNGVYLVDDDDVAAFRAEVDSLASEFEADGARVELTGPWPPYNFVKGSIEAAR